MIEKELKAFMQNITLNKKYSTYEDEKGNYMLIPTEALLTSCSRNELTKEEYTKARFNGAIKDMEYEEIEVERPVDKSTITHRENDKLTLVNVKKKAKLVYVVANNCKVNECFTNMKEALEFSKKVNEEVLSHII